MSKEQADKKKGPPFKFLLESSDGALGQFQLAKQDEVAVLRSGRRKRLGNLRSALLALFERFNDELHDQDAMFDQMVEVSAQALLAAWLRTIDRQELVRQLLEPSTVTLDGILADTKAQIRNSGRSREESETAQMPMRIFPPGVAHRNAALRYQERQIALGLCSVCPEPLDRNSVRFCTEHLAAARHREARKRGVKGEPGSRDFLYGEITESQHGRTLGTLTSLAKSREKKSRAVLAERGIPPDTAAVSLKAAIEALLKTMPHSKADAMTQAQLFEKAGVVTKTTGQKALKQLLYTGEIKRFGKGGPLDPYRYFKSGEEPTETRKLSRTKQNEALLKVMRGEERNEE